MDGLASRTFLLYLLLFVFTGAKGQQSQCENCWFGDKCQYLCHCLNGAVCDKTTGDCPGDCDREWFGPQCQYRDAAYKGTDSYLVDGIQSTCLFGNGSYQDFSMTHDVMFTWMRIVTNQPGVFDKVTMTFSLRSGAEVNPKSGGLTYILVNPTILELYGKLQDRLSGIGLFFDTPETRRSFCTMQVSAGRNVAIKQNASQSSTDQDYGADKAVDGSSAQIWSQGSCTSTQVEDSSFWALNLSLPVTVNMYTLLSTNEWWGRCKLRYFRLESYSDSRMVYYYADTVRWNKLSYDVYPVKTSPISSVTLSVSKFFWPNENYNCDNGKTTMSFCEMMTFGDVVCPKGKWGHDCEKDCNCQDSYESCFVSTGMCPFGCRAGFHGPGCQEECWDSYYGENCATPCSATCLNELCNHITGVCENCPVGKLISMDCSEDCSPGFYGPNCTKRCSEHCGGDGLCSNIDGRCLSGCKPGYRSYNCEQTCDHTTYGEGCNKTCSGNCVVNATQEPAVCEHVQGQCLLGCVSGYSGITCEEIPSEHDEINLIIIVVPILLVIILIAAVIFGIWFWRRRKTQNNGNGETGHSRIREQSGEIKSEFHMVNNAQRSSDHPSTTNPYEMANDTHSYEEIREDQVDVYSNTPETQAKFSKTAIPVDSLGEYLASHNLEFFTAQFQKMPECNATTEAAESSENKPKNRYKNILAYDYSRVRLHVNSEKKQGDYYNANFIQGFDGAKYIASQGPNRAVLADFIRMIWEQDVELVVMLTKVVEDGKVKCEAYWPTQDASEVTFGEITVELAATQVLADYTKRTLQLTKNDGESRFVTQYHFTSWPDKGVPMTPWALVDFEQVVDYHYDTEKPLLVHCSAGVGRTGTFIALRNVLKEAKVTGYVDFYQTVAKMRQDRVFMIQTVEQYCFLHDAVQVALLCQDALMTTAALDDRMKVLMEVTDTGETNIEKEFKMVCALVRKEISNDSETAATEYVNTKETGQNFFTNIKNRFSTVQAKKEHRPKLADPENEYINAVLVPSMTKQDQQVLTQLPLPNTVEDFWSLVTQYNVSLIVAFDSDKEIHDEPVGDYLPKDNKPLECGHFEIRGDKVTHGAFWERAKIHVQAKVKNPSYVHHIKCTKSNLDTKDWLVLTKELHSMAPLGNDRTLYMCMNGANQSGFACVVSLLLNRVEHDHFLTVPLVVGEIKSIRPEVIPNKDQYCFLYKILQLHCETSNVYTNHIPQSIRNTHNGVRRHSQPEHVYTNAIMSNESKEKMAAGNKAQAKRTVSEGKPLSKGSKSRPASSPEQPLTKQNLKPHNGSGEPLGYF